MSTSGEKLKRILTDGGFPSEDSEKVAAYLAGMGKALFYPRSLSMSTGISINIATEMAALLLAKGLLSHFSVPRYHGRVLSGEAQEGFITLFETLQDPDDYTPIDPKDIEVISGFRLKEA